MRKNNQPTPDLASAKLEANRIKQSKRNEILGYINKCDRTIRLCDSECAKAGEIGTDSEDLQYAAIMDRFGELVRRAKSLFTFALHSNTVLDVLNSTSTLASTVDITSLTNNLEALRTTMEDVSMLTAQDTYASQSMITPEAQQRIQQKVQKEKAREYQEAHESFIDTMNSMT